MILSFQDISEWKSRKIVRCFWLALKRISYKLNKSGGNTLRMNYSFPTVEQIEEGIQRLAAMIREVLDKKR